MVYFVTLKKFLFSKKNESSNRKYPTLIARTNNLSSEITATHSIFKTKSNQLTFVITAFYQVYFLFCDFIFYLVFKKTFLLLSVIY